jgi:hypothetical protein
MEYVIVERFLKSLVWIGPDEGSSLASFEYPWNENQTKALSALLSELKDKKTDVDVDVDVLKLKVLNYKGFS